MEQEVTLYYAYDPMCSWCWGYAPTWEILRSHVERRHGGEVSVRKLLGGLAPDSDEPMPASMQDYLQGTWKRIQEQIPGTKFNFDFWTACMPRRSTWPACRAVIAARNQGDHFEDLMSRAIQHAYYLEARNPSKRETLAAIAEEIGLDPTRFKGDLDLPETHDVHQKEMRLTRKLGVQGFPSLVLVRDQTAHPVLVDYSGVQKTIGHIDRLVEQPVAQKTAQSAV